MDLASCCRRRADSISDLPLRAMRALTLSAASMHCHKQPADLGALGKQDATDQWHYQAYREVLRFDMEPVEFCRSFGLEAKLCIATFGHDGTTIPAGSKLASAFQGVDQLGCDHFILSDGYLVCVEVAVLLSEDAFVDYVAGRPHPFDSWASGELVRNVRHMVRSDQDEVTLRSFTRGTRCVAC
eukprot:3888010-Amphidinium_carterae.2